VVFNIADSSKYNNIQCLGFLLVYILQLSNELKQSDNNDDYLDVVLSWKLHNSLTSDVLTTCLYNCTRVFVNGLQLT